MMDKEAREKIAEILDDITGGDTEFDREGGYSPEADYCDEMAAQILQALIKLGYRKLPKDKPPLKLIWFILDEIATKASARNEGDLSNRAVEAMRLIPIKPSPKECRELYERRK